MEKKILGIPYLEFGNTIKIAGMVLQGNKHTETVLFPESMHDLTYGTKNVSVLNHEEWKELLYQLDIVETEILDPNNKNQKVVVRKSAREVEQQVNWNVFRRDGYTCRYCGNDKTPLTVDHVVLWEHMGASVEDNLITACRKCNKTRGNMLYPDWLESNYYKNAMKGFKLTEIAQHIVNEQAWSKAQAVPLRVTKRGR